MHTNYGHYASVERRARFPALPRASPLINCPCHRDAGKEYSGSRLRCRRISTAVSTCRDPYRVSDCQTFENLSLERARDTPARKIHCFYSSCNRVPWSTSFATGRNFDNENRVHSERTVYERDKKISLWQYFILRTSEFVIRFNWGFGHDTADGHLIFHDAVIVTMLARYGSLSSGRPFDFTARNKSRTTGACPPDGNTRNIKRGRNGGRGGRERAGVDI